MAERVARNNGSVTVAGVAPGELRVVDDTALDVVDAVAAGLLELDPSNGRSAPATPIRPVP